MTEEIRLAFSTFPDAESAQRAATQLVEENLAACANLIPSVSSIYRWENKLECSTEVFVLFKTTAKSYKIFEEKLKLLHPYDVPEVVAVTVSDGSATYLNWVLGNCSG